MKRDARIGRRWTSRHAPVVVTLFGKGGVALLGLLSILASTAPPTSALAQLAQLGGELSPSQPCSGDCDNDGQVTVNEIVAGIRIAGGGSGIEACPSLDRDGSAGISVDEILSAVSSLLGGCVRRPSFLLVNLDDARDDGLDRMPQLLARVAGEGARFENSFVTTPLCAPSRASLLTGLYASRHGTRTLSEPLGGAETFRRSGADRRTIALRLHASGYRTGLFGKYVNGYDESEEGLGPEGRFYVPPGWDCWRAMRSPEAYGGMHGRAYTIIDERGDQQRFDDHTSDASYSTDVEGEDLRAFIADSVAAGRPFFAVWAPTAPHNESPYAASPADRHFDTLCPLEPWRPPNWNEADVTDKPRWVGAEPSDPQFTDLARCRAYESLLSVDEQLGQTLDLLESLGVESDTVVLVTSDNGVGWGEHRIWVQNKECPYEECLRVPLLVRYPRRAAVGVVRDAPVANIDLAPTIAALAGVRLPAVDGRSFAAELTEESPPAEERRTDFLIEHWRTVRSDGVAYGTQAHDGGRLRLWFGDPRARPRPSIVFGFDAGDGVGAAAVAVKIGPSGSATFNALRHSVSSLLGLPGFLTLFGSDILTTFDRSTSHDGVYWWEEADEENNFEPRYPLPDYWGVRDVANGLIWVEYETGEHELFDLAADPDELENKADDPAYAGVRARLELRLSELLAEIAAPK